MTKKNKEYTIIVCKENYFTRHFKINFIKLDFEWSFKILNKDLKISLLLDVYGNILSDRQKITLDYYYNKDFSLSEISENLGITRQGVRDSIVRGKKILKDTEKKLKFFELQNQRTLYIDKIYILLNKISEYNKKKLLSKEFDGLISEIINILSKLN